MHLTLSKNFIGRIDSVTKEDKFHRIKGWVVPLIAADTCSIGCDGFVSITPEERKDVYEFYRKENINYLRSGFNILLEPKTDVTNIYVNDELVFEAKAEILESILLPNTKTKPELIVVDNFYDNVDAVR